MPIIPISGSATARGALVPIGSIVVTGTTTTDVTFTTIPQIYQDLMLVLYGRRTDNANFANNFITPYNLSVPATPQSATILQVDQTSAITSFRYSNQDASYTGILPAAFTSPFVFGSTVWNCLNYAGTTGFKTSITQSVSDINNQGVARITAATTRTTSGITTVNCSTFSGSAYFAVGTTATLYGVRSVNQ